MSEFKGGRGNKAPYQTTHIRIPEPLKPEIEAIVADFKQRVATGELDLSKHQTFHLISIPVELEHRLEKLNSLLERYELELTPERINQPRWKNVYKLVNEIKSILE